MARKRIPDAEGLEALPRALGETPAREDTALAVRWLLQVLAERVPGNAVEVRVPPFGAVQAVEGPRHTRGTPPNVVEMNAATWLALATGRRSWAAATEAGEVHASGARADLTAFLPLISRKMDA